ncbi:MAG: glycosyltransferase [Fuerstiella sp.]
MSRLKVVFSIGAMHGGGSERQLLMLLQHLDRQRFEPYLYLIYPTGPLLDDVPDDVPITSFEQRHGPPRGPGFLMHRRRVDDMAAFLNQVQADVSYDRTFLMTLIAAAAAQQVNVPNVSTIVTDPPVGFPAVAGRFQWMKRRLLRRLYCRSGRVLANSDGAARSAERFYGLPPGLVQPHYNGVDLKRIDQLAALPVADEWWNSPAESSSAPPFRIVTAGRLDERKGFHLLIDAVRIIGRQSDSLQPASPELRLAILGEGPLQERLQQQIDAASLQRHVRLCGFQANAPAWFRSADLFVLPSLLEGMPNVLLEAMACGTAVLSADCDSGPRELLQSGRFGKLCAVNSVTALKDGIQEFVADERLSVRYTSAARAHIEQSFSCDQATRKLENILQEVVNSHVADTGKQAR